MPQQKQPTTGSAHSASHGISLFEHYRDSDRNSYNYSILVAAQQQQQTAASDPCLSIYSTLQLNISQAEKNLMLIVGCSGSKISIDEDR